MTAADRDNLIEAIEWIDRFALQCEWKQPDDGYWLLYKARRHLIRQWKLGLRPLLVYGGPESA